MMRRSSLTVAPAVLLAGLLVIGIGPSCLAEDGYRLPPKAIVDLLDAPPTPGVSIDPTGTWMLIVERPSMPAIDVLAQPMLRLAGMRINPRTNGTFTTSYDIGLQLKRLSDGMTFPVAVPAGARLGGTSWAPDGARFAFTITRDDGIELWSADVTTRRARRLTGRLNGAARSPYRWMTDGRHLLCKVVPADRGPMPEAAPVPAGPVVQETTGGVAPVRTYQDLLTGPHDEALFDWIMTSELVRIDTESGDATMIGGKAIYAQVTPAPDGRHLLISRIQRPYSYLVPAYRFPEIVEVWDTEGRRVSHVVDVPLREEVPIEGVETGPRSIGWQPHVDTARLVWAEALDGGDPKVEVPHRDRVMALDAPFTGAPREIARTEHRYRGITWIEGSSVMLLSEYDRDRRWQRTWRLDLAAPQAEPRLVWDRSVRDRYGDPGRPLMTTNRAGFPVAMLDGGRIYLSGRGATPKGDRPFLDRMSLEDLETERIWRCPDGAYASVVEVLPGGRGIISRYETPEVPPNYFLSDLAGMQRRQLTDFPDPQPQLRGIHQELVTYTRDDGVDLSATLYLPADHQPGQRLPLLVWAYPREYNDPYTAGQVSGSPYRFTRIGGASHLLLLTQGYAVMDGATMPVIGDPETMNDTFIDQIVGSAKAAIDYAAERGVADPNRVGVGGHSYGAFMTANLLAHCDLFRAGVARSGAYNRTLTPFGFQSERRTLWEAPMAYFRISPFMHANKVNEPILLVHGEIDNNSGTFPLQSQRMYHALKGHGATARLVMLPHESHGYRARESVMHVVAEMLAWFDQHVKYADTPAPAELGTAAAGD